MAALSCANTAAKSGNQASGLADGVPTEVATGVEVAETFSVFAGSACANSRIFAVASAVGVALAAAGVDEGGAEVTGAGATDAALFFCGLSNAASCSCSRAFSARSDSAEKSVPGFAACEVAVVELVGVVATGAAGAAGAIGGATTGAGTLGAVATGAGTVGFASAARGKLNVPVSGNTDFGALELTVNSVFTTNGTAGAAGIVVALDAGVVGAAGVEAAAEGAGFVGAGIVASFSAQAAITGADTFASTVAALATGAGIAAICGAMGEPVAGAACTTLGVPGCGARRSPGKRMPQKPTTVSVNSSST